MAIEYKPVTAKRIVFVCFGLALPAMLLSAYVWSRLFVAYGSNFPQAVQPFGLLVVMWAAMWLTSGRLIRDLKVGKKAQLGIQRDGPASGGSAR